MTLNAIAHTPDERLALLLSILGDDFAASALRDIDPAHGGTLERLYREFKADPPSSEELDFVVGDFMRYFDFAVETLGSKVEKAREEKKPAPRGSSQATTIYFSTLTPSDDPVSDLNRLDAYQIVKAIGKDHPKTIAMVLRKLDVKQAAQVIEQLHSETRGNVIKFLTVESTVPASILNQVLKTTVQRACVVTSRPPEVDQSQSLAELMRSLPKQMRVDLMKQLADADADLGARVKSRLYIFTDILRLEDRDVQKLLGQIETDALIIGLQQSEQQMTDKLLNNLSKRARETVMEEMEYKKSASQVEIDDARKKIVEALAELDESGEIKM